VQDKHCSSLHNNDDVQEAARDDVHMSRRAYSKTSTAPN